MASSAPQCRNSDPVSRIGHAFRQSAFGFHTDHLWHASAAEHSYPALHLAADKSLPPPSAELAVDDAFVTLGKCAFRSEQFRAVLETLIRHTVDGTIVADFASIGVRALATMWTGDKNALDDHRYSGNFVAFGF